MKSPYYELYVCKICEEKFPSGHLKINFLSECAKIYLPKKATMPLSGSLLLSLAPRV